MAAGSFLNVAAEASGVSKRTLQEWLQRGEAAHPSRPPTPELEAFAREVRIARAQARAGAEIRVYREFPKYWLAHAARSTREDDGWTDLPNSPEEQSISERVAELIRNLDAEPSDDRGHVDLPPPPPDEGR